MCARPGMHAGHGTGVDTCASVPATLLRHRHRAAAAARLRCVFTLPSSWRTMRVRDFWSHPLPGFLPSALDVECCRRQQAGGRLAWLAVAAAALRPPGGGGAGDEQPDARELGFQPQATATVQTCDQATRDWSRPRPRQAERWRRLHTSPSRSHHSTRVEVRADWETAWRKQPGRRPASTTYISSAVRPAPTGYRRGAHAHIRTQALKLFQNSHSSKEGHSGSVNSSTTVLRRVFSLL